MENRMKILLVVFITIGFMATSVAAQDWAIKADYTESCSCNPACPYLFGSPSTHGYCRGNHLIEIKEGHYGNVRLDGISVVTAFSLGKWLKIYINEKATDVQANALLALLKLEPTFGLVYSGDSKILSKKKVPISIEKTPTTVKFSVPDSVVEIEVMRELGGKPIKIQNLSLPFMNDHTQYKSIILSHKSGDKAFKHSGTNGLTANISASGKI